MYYSPYFLAQYRQNGLTHLKITDFVPFFHRWVEIRFIGEDPSGFPKKTVFVLNITGPNSVEFLDYPSLRVVTYDVRQMLSVIEVMHPPMCTTVPYL